MKEIRKDSITGDIVIYSSFRSKRPHDKVNYQEGFKNDGSEYNEDCPFCRGNETYEDDLKGNICVDGAWVTKSVANKFPIVDMDTEQLFGEHEVVIETYRHNGTFYNMNKDEFELFFTLLRDRYSDMNSKRGIKYTNIFKNFLRNSGASLMHPHSQITSFNLVPPEILKELAVANFYYEKSEMSLYDNIVFSEIEYEKRIVHNGEYFIVFIPYATRYNGEIRIIEKDRLKIEEWTESHIGELSYIFENLFVKWDGYQGEVPFNMLIHTYPNNDKSDDTDYRKVFRTHFHIIPRRYNFGGFELSTNLFVCGTDPDEMASEMQF